MTGDPKADHAGKWRAQILDGLTITVALAALVVLVGRFLGHEGRRESAADRARAVEESQLVGRRPALIELGPVGAQLDSALRTNGPKRALLLVFRDDCPACLRTKPVWERLAASLAPSVPVHAITGVTGAESRRFFQSPRVTVWQVNAGGAAVARAFSSKWVPTTIVLSSTGTIELARIGALSSTDADALVAMLRVGNGAQRR